MMPVQGNADFQGGYPQGGMIAHAYTHLFPDAVASLIWGECPLPGTTVYDDYKHPAGLWHFSFHPVPDLPELLVARSNT